MCNMSNTVFGGRVEELIIEAGKGHLHDPVPEMVDLFSHISRDYIESPIGFSLL